MEEGNSFTISIVFPRVEAIFSRERKLTERLLVRDIVSTTIIVRVQYKCAELRRFVLKE